MSEIIRAKQFVVVDDEGRERARLEMHNGRVGLEVFGSDDDQPSIVLEQCEDGNTRLSLTKHSKTADLEVSDQDVSLRLSDASKPASVCRMSMDAAGAWLVAEANPAAGVRIFSKDNGKATAVWLSESFVEQGSSYIRTRYLHTDPAEDEVSGWRTTC